MAIRDYLADGLPGRVPKTIRTQREVLVPLLPLLGNVPLRELTAADVRSALIKLATTRVIQTVYRHELRPVVTSGAEIVDRIFADAAK